MRIYGDLHNSDDGWGCPTFDASRGSAIIMAGNLRDSKRQLTQFVRRFTSGGAPRLVWRLIRLLDPYVVASYSQEGEDMVIRRIFDGVEDGFYVDVGTHHPMRYSNTCFFYQRGWRGINIDADAGALAAFQRARPNDVNLAVGVSDEVGTLDFNVFSDPALNTFDSRLADERACQVIAVLQL